jgi:hypothetical protein
MLKTKVVSLVLFILLAAILAACGSVPVPSRWKPPGGSSAASAQSENQGGLVGVAEETSASRARPAPQPRVFIEDPGDEALAAFTAASEFRGDAANGAIRHYSRPLPGGGRISYVVAELRDGVNMRVITADGATLTSDASGDTMWADGQAHLATVVEMATSPYALLDGRPPLAAMAFGFHGARTSDEGTVVIDGVLQHINPWRAAICMGHDGVPTVGIYDRRGLEECAQAAGAGPVLIWRGKIATPDVASETDAFLPYNPLGEDFQQIDYRVENFRGRRPKTALCIGVLRSGVFYLVLANGTNSTGTELAQAMRELGCVDAIGGDDGSSTQMVWQGQAVDGLVGREVPTAIGLYGP